MLHETRIVSDDASAFVFAKPQAPAEAGDGPALITVPDAHLLFNGDFQRAGPDLKIVGEAGNGVLIPDYFKAEKRPTLLSPEGAALTGDIVEALAGPLAPGQYAQAGQQAADQPAIGRVEQVAGNATIVRNGVAMTVSQGDVVRKGDVVQTGSDGKIAVLFADGSTFSLSANARMVLNEFVYQAGGSNNSALISLVQGTIGFVAGQVAKTGDMRVDTPVATMGIRGTAVLVEITANNGQTKFSVLVEPDGTTGSFNLYDKSTGTLLATVNNSQIGWVVSPVGPLQVIAQQIQKTPGELQQELDYFQQIFNIFNQGQQNPFNPDDHTNVNPQNTNGQGTQFTTTFPQNPFASLITNLTTPATFQFTLPNNNDPDLDFPESPPEIITITVAPNQPPIAVDDQQGTPNGGDVTQNDSDPEGGVIVVTSVKFLPDGAVVPVNATNTEIQGKYGKLIISPDGNYSYVPSGADYDKLKGGDGVVELFQYTISDPFGATASATLTINVEGVNDKPEALADTDGVQAAGLVDGHPTLGDPIATGNVLTNDTDVDAGDSKRVIGVKAGDHASDEGGVLGHVNAIIQGTYGFLVLFADGKYIYTLNNLDPDTIRLGEDEHGADVFTYTMADADGLTSTTTLTIDVTGANSAPVITGGVRTGSVTEDAQIDWVSGTLNKTDVDNNDDASNDAWSLDLRQGQTRVDDFTVQGKYGTLTVDQNGTWTYTLDNSLPATQALNTGDHPVEVFTVKVTDSHGASDTRTISVTVHGVDEPNNSPADVAFMAGQNIEAAESTLWLNGNKVLGQFLATDPDGDTVTYSLGQGSSHFFSLSPNGTLKTNVLGAPSSLNDQTYNLNVIATDQHGASTSEQIKVWVGTGPIQFQHNGNDSPDHLVGLTQDIIAFGLGGDDMITTGSGDDVLVGGKGKDILNGGAGDDTLIGGAGNDTFVFAANFGHDTILDFEIGKDQIRFIDLFDNYTALQSAMSQNGNDTVIALDDDNTITLSNVQLANLNQSHFDFA